MVDCDYDFALGSPFAKILERGRNFMQRIQPIDEGGDFACSTEFRNMSQVFGVWLHG